MIIERLLLPCGGVIGNQSRAKQQTDTATLCIGLGGVGVKTLASLKCKIRQQLEPDYPDAPDPEYGGIRLLAMDWDDGAYRAYNGDCSLSDQEYFPIHRENLWALNQEPALKRVIKASPYLDWMDVDGISSLMHQDPQGRQIGRYLIFECATRLTEKIRELCTAALSERHSSKLDIHIFSGISGGTVSGGLWDVCYLIRHMVQSCGWNARIMGYFFLPDVLSQRPGWTTLPEAVQYHNGAGYGALKELDYLMDLQKVNDYFAQRYTEQLAIKTQQSPVDTCFLVSTPDAEEPFATTGLSYAVDSVSEYVMQWLVRSENTDTRTMNEMTLHGDRAAQGIPQRSGANFCYHVLGINSAKIPWNEINTYLSAGFFREFFRRVSAKRVIIPESFIKQFLVDHQLRAEDIYASVNRGLPALHLPEIDPAELASEPCCRKGTLPRHWAQAANQWLTECRRLRQRNGDDLTKTLTDYNYEADHERSLIGKLFHALYQLAADPEYGPVFAAYLLIDRGNDLYTALYQEIAKAENYSQSLQNQITDVEQWVLESNQYLIDSSRLRRKSAYSVFKDAAENWAGYVNQFEQSCKTGEVLETFRGQIKELHSNFFRPLSELLHHLQETFEANMAYLQSERADERNCCTWNIVELSDVQPLLNRVIGALDMQQETSHFLVRLLNDPDVWQKQDQNRITQFICNQMTRLFGSQMQFDLKDFLTMKWPADNQDPVAFRRQLQNHLLSKLDNRMQPLFRSRPGFEMDDNDAVFRKDGFLLPDSILTYEPVFADYRCNSGRYCGVNTYGRPDRITLMTMISGVPMYAYQGITEFKPDYDNLGGTCSGGAIHLYANTGRGTDGTGAKDWFRVLPEPLPWSQVQQPDAAEFEKERQALQLYRDACACGVITQKGWPFEDCGKYVLCISDLPEQTLSLEALMADGQFTMRRYEETKEQYRQLLSLMHQPVDQQNCMTIALPEGGCGQVRDAVRLDYFIKSPTLQALTRQQLEKRKRLENLLEQLDSLLKMDEDYAKNLNLFAYLLFFRYLNCTNAMGYVDYMNTTDIWVASSMETKLVLLNSAMPMFRLPLYQAFVIMRQWFQVVTGLPKSAQLEPYDEIDLRNLYTDLSLRMEECRRKKRMTSDYLVPAILEQIYTASWLDALTRGDLFNTYSLDERKEIVRFYKGLLDRLAVLKNDSISWPVGYSLQQLSEALRDVPQWYI